MKKSSIAAALIVLAFYGAVIGVGIWLLTPTTPAADQSIDLTAPIAVKVAILEERIAAAQKALELQWVETQRRLHELNGEAERLRTMQASYVPRETYEGKVEELEKNIRTIDLAQSKMIVTMTIVGALAGILAAALVRYIFPGPKGRVAT